MSGVRIQITLVIVMSLVTIGHLQDNQPPSNQDKKNSFLQLKSTTPSSTLSSNSKETKHQVDDEIMKGVERSLLQMFGLKSRPRPKRSIHIPQYIMDMYNQHLGDIEEFDINMFRTNGVRSFPEANTIRSFFHEDLPRKHETSTESDNKVLLHFNVSEIPDIEKLTGAELRLYRETPEEEHLYKFNNRSDNLKHRIDIYEILKPASKSREAITRLLDTRTVKLQKTSWESFDIHPAVLKWRDSPKLNHGLEIHVSDPKGESDSVPHVRLRRSAHQRADKKEKGWKKQQPFLVTYTDDGKARKKTRTRRNSKHKNKRKSGRRRKTRRHNRNCKRHSLHVLFSEVGWDDWIVAPPSYDAFYCAGECPFPLADHFNATNHAIVQTLVNSINPQAVPTACCVPTELSPMALLYVDEADKVVLKTYEDMTVVGCGCR